MSDKFAVNFKLNKPEEVSVSIVNALKSARLQGLAVSPGSMISDINMLPISKPGVTNWIALSSSATINHRALALPAAALPEV